MSMGQVIQAASVCAILLAGATQERARRPVRQSSSLANAHPGALDWGFGRAFGSHGDRTMGSRARVTAMWRCRPRRCLGWTLIELLFVIGIIGTLANLAIPAVHDAIDRAKVAKASEDIRTMEAEFAGFQANGDSLATSLAGIGRAGFLDPWGNPYQYLRIAGSGKLVLAQARKDRFLVPLNSDYDLYSMGKDGQSMPPLTAAVSRDDIVRANDGVYVGLASRY